MISIRRSRGTARVDRAHEAEDLGRAFSPLLGRGFELARIRRAEAEALFQQPADHRALAGIEAVVDTRRLDQQRRDGKLQPVAAAARDIAVIFLEPRRQSTKHDFA